jgi:hypothetical protein
MDQDPRQSEPSRRPSDGQIQVLKTLANPMAVDVGLSVIDRDAVRAALARIAELETAIRKHRDQRGDDRCWLDDHDLYAHVGIPADHDSRLPPKEEFLESCQRFWEQRRAPHDLDPSPGCMTIRQQQARIAELEQLNRRLLDHLRFLGHTTEIDANGNILSDVKGDTLAENQKLMHDREILVETAEAIQATIREALKAVKRKEGMNIYVGS